MKKLGLVLLLMVGCMAANAQQIDAQQVLSFFEKNGTIRLETQELVDASKNLDSLVTVRHRKDDIVWARITYRIIDMRFKQNYQLYFPVAPDDAAYQNLFRLILDAVAKGMPIYDVDMRNFVPLFNDSTRIDPRNYRNGTYFTALDSEGDYDQRDDESFLARYDSIQDRVVLNFERYPNFVRNQIKYLIQEVIYFDKHTSRLHRQLIAIAPLQADMVSATDPMEFLQGSIRFWILYQDLRPYLAQRYMIPIQNETRRMTFDDFFQKRMYTSYLVGEGNMYNRMILDYAKNEKDAKREQERIETELLSFEQDLWEY